MKIDFAFLSDAATEAGGKLNALGIGIDRVVVRELPQAHPQLALVTRVAFDLEDSHQQSFSIELIGPDGRRVTPLVQGEFKVRADEASGISRANIIVQIANAKFTTAGPHEAKLTVGGAEVVALPLEVVLGG